MAQVAETLNSLANVYRLEGDLQQARLMCQTSLLLRQAWAPEEVTKSQYVMGMILWEMGGTTEAIRYLRQADESCSPGDETTRALIKKYRAYVLYRVGLPRQAVPQLEQAELVLRRRGQFSELADVLNILSRICRDQPEAVPEGLAGQDHLEVATHYARQALDIAQRIGDQYRLAECHLTQALHAYRRARKAASDRALSLTEVRQHCLAGIALAQDRYYQLFSQFNAVLGDLAFERHNYPEAFEYYFNQCVHAAHFKRATYERGLDHLGERLRELSAKDSIQARSLGEDLITRWQSAPGRMQTDKEFLEEIHEIQHASRDRDDVTQLRRQYQQAVRAGHWTLAIGYCDQVLQMASLYQDPVRAQYILDKAAATYRAGDLPAARRLAKVALQIGLERNDQAISGQAHLLLATVLWDATSTAECADHLNQAESIFQRIDDKVGLARVNRLRGYVLQRTGFWQEPIGYLIEAAETFERQELHAELADVLNLRSRIARTAPGQSDVTQAHEYVLRAIDMAEQARDNYRLAECHLSEAILALRQQAYDRVLAEYKTGQTCLSEEMHLLHSVYEGVRGTALYEQALGRGDQAGRATLLDQAFAAFDLELYEATKSKPARLMGALDLIFVMLMRLPWEDTQRYSRQLQQAWQLHQAGDHFLHVDAMFEQALKYRPYLETAGPH